MKRRKTIRETKNMIQTALWLPRDMHEKLKKSGGERGLGEEIRRRLQFAFEADRQPHDPPTELVADLMRRVALDLTDGNTSWIERRWTCDVFKDAVVELISSLCSTGVPMERGPEPAVMAKLQAKYGPDLKPEAIGSVLANSAIVEHTKERSRWTIGGR